MKNSNQTNLNVFLTHVDQSFLDSNFTSECLLLLCELQWMFREYRSGDVFDKINNTALFSSSSNTIKTICLSRRNKQRAELCVGILPSRSKAGLMRPPVDSVLFGCDLHMEVILCRDVIPIHLYGRSGRIRRKFIRLSQAKLHCYFN